MQNQDYFIAKISTEDDGEPTFAMASRKSRITSIVSGLASQK